MIPRNKNVFCLHCSMHRHRSLSPWNRDDCESLLCFKEASCSQLFNGWQTSGKKEEGSDVNHKIFDNDETLTVC